MKKINIIFITLILMMSMVACSNTNEVDGDISEILNDIEENAVEQANKYEEYFGIWYGFGTDGENAQFEIMIEPKDEFSVNVLIKGTGINGNLEQEHIVVVFSTFTEAFESTENQQRRNFTFSTDEYGNQVMEIKFIDKTTGKQIAESIEAGRFSDRNASFGSGQAENVQTGSNYSSEKDNFRKRYDTLNVKCVKEAPPHKKEIQSAELYYEWDCLLNDVYQYLKTIKSTSEFETIKSDEEAWVKEKDAAVEASRNEYAGGSLASLAANTTAITYTKDRCKYLISLIG